MKNIVLFLIASFIGFLSCTNDQGEAPQITVDSVYVDNIRLLDFTQPLPLGSKIDVYATLLASMGTSLYTFNVQAAPQKTAALATLTTTVNNIETAIIVKNDPDISINYGDTTLVFKDRVRETNVIVQTILPEISGQEELDFKLLLNLNTKDAGVLEKLDFKARYLH